MNRGYLAYQENDYQLETTTYKALIISRRSLIEIEHNYYLLNTNLNPYRKSLKMFQL